MAAEVRQQRLRLQGREALVVWELARVEVYLVAKAAQVSSVVAKRSPRMLGLGEEPVSLGEVQRHKEEDFLEPHQLKASLTTREVSS